MPISKDSHRAFCGPLKKFSYGFSSRRSYGLFAVGWLVNMKAPQPNVRKRNNTTVDQPEAFAPANWPLMAMTTLSPLVMNKSQRNSSLQHNLRYAPCEPCQHTQTNERSAPELIYNQTHWR